MSSNQTKNQALAYLFSTVLLITPQVGLTQSHDHHGHQHTQSEVQGQHYYCPMHPEETSDQPGRCPKCNMFLVTGEKEGSSDEQASEHKYYCPMHP
ncbi:heavy metal-binding domain-containing protein, partial [Shewanella waksmanii]|uniref:heavy metal-binding domain-containing protein n=1 Tax=Shewanella waksmanii TaxID=213783 RepID=UPI0037360FA8